MNKLISRSVAVLVRPWQRCASIFMVTVSCLVAIVTLGQQVAVSQDLPSGHLKSGSPAPAGELVGPTASEVSRTPYQVTRNESCGSTTCDVDFPVVPANRRLEITFASCSALGASSVSLVDATLLTKSNKVFHFFGAPWQRSVAGGNGWNFSQQIFLFVPAGERATARLFSTANLKIAACTISGHMVKLTPPPTTGTD